MSSHVDKQILRLFMLIHKVCLPVVRKFFEKFILCKQEYDNKFEKFLERHKHDLYHMFCEVRCCECNTKTHKNECGQIFREHFVLMYDMGMPNHSHIKKKKDTDIAVQNCICGIKVKLACSKKNLDLSTLNAILRLFQTHLNNNHIMWLKMISKERNTLCHLSEFNQLTESDVNTMWGYLEMAVMGLATDIPVEDYEDDIKTQIELLKEIDYSQDKVQPIIDEMKRGVRTIETLQNQQNEWMKEEFNRLQSTREDDKKELIEHLSQFKDEIVSHQDRNTKAQEAKLDSVLEQLVRSNFTNVGKLFHKTKDQLYHVEYSFDSSFRLVADAQSKGAELESMEFETGPESQRDVAGHNDVCIYWKMKPKCCSKEEMDDIKASMRKAAQSLDCWFPYKITHIFDGSIVIGTIISGDVLESKHKFEESIRKFLDVFSSVFGLHRQVTIDVEIVISKSPSAAISNYCCYETCKATTRDKGVLATPHMFDKVVEASLDIDYTANQIYAIKKTDQGKTVLLIFLNHFQTFVVKCCLVG